MNGVKTFKKREKFVRGQGQCILKHVSCASCVTVEKNNAKRESVFWIIAGLIRFSVKARFQSAAHGWKRLEHTAEMDHDL